MFAVIDGQLFEITDADDTRHGLPARIQAGRNYEWYVFEDSEAAEAAAKQRVRDLARHDATEFLALYGSEKIVDMFMAGQTLEDLLNDVDPAQEFATYDGCELDITPMREWLTATSRGEPNWKSVPLTENYVRGWKELIDELGFEPTVAYRT